MSFKEIFKSISLSKNANKDVVNGRLMNKRTGKTIMPIEYLHDESIFNEVIFDIHNYLVEVSGEYYEACDVYKATEHGCSMLEAVQNLDPFHLSIGKKRK